MGKFTVRGVKERKSKRLTGKDQKQKMTYKRTVYRRPPCDRRTHCPDRVSACMPVREKRECAVLIYAEVPSLAAVYGINQQWRDVEDGDRGFARGTIFCELYKPFYGDKCNKNGGCFK